jgi:hypothetical protein
MVLFLSSRLGLTIDVNPNTVGYILSVGAIISFFLGFDTGKKAYWLLIPVFSVLSFYTASRKVFILLSIGLILIYLLQQKSLQKAGLALGIGLILLILCIFALLLIEPLRRAFGQRFFMMFSELLGRSGDESVSIRMGMLKSGISMFKQKPIFGWGLGAFTDLGGFDNYAHNNYVELLVAVGLVGTLVYYSLCFSIVIQGLKRFFRFEKKGSFVLSTAIMTAMLFDQVARVTYTEEFSNILIAMCYAGIVLDTPDKGLDFFQLMAKIGEYIRHPSRFVNHLLKSKLARLLPNTLFLSLKYRMSNGKKCNIKEPSTYNEKLQWQKIYDHNPLYPHIFDKYEVRSHVSSLIGES